MNNKNRNILIFIGIAIFLLGGLFLLFNKSHAYHELPKVKLKDNDNVKQLALMVEQTKGTGNYEDKSAEYVSAFPTNGYRLNEGMSGCTDMNGKTIDNAIEYDYDNYTLTVNTSNTAYCYLYYDIYEG